ncbi:MAG: hypothetical protein K0R51_1572, partial [Cytophagaceae bacterium]|nr:hypothetical protein [Cytophagaceae bacterium]
YSISLNNSVKDITEANAVKNVTYAFSTGPKLDSLTFSGKTFNLDTKQLLKEVMVGLYEKSDTINVTKHKPLYLTYSSNEGNFSFKYLKEGDYFLVAIEDKNKNLLFDNQEKSDFIEQISLNNAFGKPITLELSVSDTTGNKLLSNKPGIRKQELNFRNGIKSYSYRTVNPKDELYILQQRKKAKDLVVYAINFEQDTLGYILSTIDSLGNRLEDTLKLDRPKKDTYKEPAVFSSTTKDILPGTKSVVFTSSKPIVQLQTDSILINGTVVATKPTLSKNADSLFLTLTSTELKSDTTKVIFKKGSFIYHDQDTSTQATFFFLKADLANYSLLEMNIKTKEPNYIIQLLTEDYTILEEYKNITILKYDYINPGTYRIRAVVDKNNNGYWDRAYPTTKQKAEPIYYYNNDKINLKPNWELRDLMFIF